MLWAPAPRSTTPLRGAVHRVRGTSEREPHAAQFRRRFYVDVMPRVPDAVQRSRCSAEPGPILAVVMLWAPALRSTTPLRGAVHRVRGTSEREPHAAQSRAAFLCGRDASCPGRGAAFTLLRRAGTHTCGRYVMGPGSAEHHAAARRSAPRPGHERTRASARRVGQRAENPRPRTNALVKTLQVVFFVRRMDVVVVETKADQHGVETERALEIRDDRDRGA
jgi:hypothetical protein